MCKSILAIKRLGVVGAITFILSSCNYINQYFQSSANNTSKEDSIAQQLTKDFVNPGSLDYLEDAVLMDTTEAKKDTVSGERLVDTVFQKEPEKPVVEKTSRKKPYRVELVDKPKHIYITFDDGPLLGSSSIDSIISAKNIKSSVFLVGKHANMSKRLYKDYEKYASNPLIECYNHSYSHANHHYEKFYSNPDNVLKDFDTNQNYFELPHKIARMPGRNIWMLDSLSYVDIKGSRRAAEVLHENGYNIYGWDVEWRINGVTGVPDRPLAQVYKEIKNLLEKQQSLVANNVVLLMHDDMFRNEKGQQLLAGLIDSLQQHPDYHFEYIRDYPKKY